MNAPPSPRPAGPLVGRQFVRFLVVGCLNVAVTFTVFVLCYRWLHVGGVLVELTGGSGSALARALSALGVGSIDAAVANAVGYVAGMVNSFVLNKLWTFEAAGHTSRQLRRFVALNLVSLAVSTAIMFVAVDMLVAPYAPVFVATVALTTVFHFVANRHWTFAEARQAAPVVLGSQRP
jgi:putative flippase GtrA